MQGTWCTPLGARHANRRERGPGEDRFPLFSKTCAGRARGACMTSTRRRQAPLAPGAGISTRSSRGSRWSSRCRQPTVLLRLVVMFKLVLVEAPAPAPAVLQSVLFGQKLEDNYWGTRRVVDVASPTVLEEHDCSAAAPCWALVRGDTPLAPFADGVQLSSVRSRL